MARNWVFQGEEQGREQKDNPDQGYLVYLFLVIPLLLTLLEGIWLAHIQSGLSKHISQLY